MNPQHLDVSTGASHPARHGDEQAAFVLLHTQPRLSLATDLLLLTPEQAPAFSDAMTLANHLARLHDEEAARIQAATAAGHAEGLAAGLAQGRLEAQRHAAAQLAVTGRQLAERAETEAQRLEQQVVQLALLVVRRIAAGLAPEQVLAALARQALDHLAQGRSATAVAIDPAPWAGCQLRLPAALLPQVQAQLGEAPGLRVVADESLAELDCVLDTPAGRLLAGLETQLGRVQARLMQNDAGSGASPHPEAASGERHRAATLP